ncbi:MAG: VWA domain-containing protein [Spirochaetales bacterium]|nr:VWA domain-containing protein [Candidatus Physcosoma equi]
MNQNLTEVVFILDRSGSMWHLTEDTIGGFNAMLEKEKQGEGKCLLSTVLFNHQSTVLYDRIQIEKANPMTEKDYVPGGSTALYDALGDAIHHISNVHKYAREEDRPGKTIFFITTDGMENASHRYGGEELRKMIEEKKEKGWEFLFLASDIRALDQAYSIGIQKDRISVMADTSEGTVDAYDCMEEVVTSVRQRKAIRKDWNAPIMDGMKKREKNGRA